MTRDEFVSRYGGVYEHSPWVAERAFDRHGAITDSLAPALAAIVDAATDEEKLTLIRAHPDLAGRAAVAGELTRDSTAEQRSAGIERLSKADYARLQALNARYKDRFGFPFVMAVRGSSVQAILRAFDARLRHDRETEFDTAIAEIHKIARLRLEAMDSR